jgi:hypothetical protein
VRAAKYKTSGAALLDPAKLFDRTRQGMVKAAQRLTKNKRATPPKGKKTGPPLMFPPKSDAYEDARELLATKQPQQSLMWAAKQLDTSASTLSCSFGTAAADAHAPSTKGLRSTEA